MFSNEQACDQQRERRGSAATSEVESLDLDLESITRDPFGLRQAMSSVQQVGQRQSVRLGYT